MGDKKPAGNDKMYVARIDDPIWLGAHAKKMARELLTKEFAGPGDTIEAAAYRIQRERRVDAKIILQLWNRPPREMKVSRWMSVFRAHYEAFKNDAPARYASAREEADAAGVSPAIRRLADFVAGGAVETSQEPDLTE